MTDILNLPGWSVLAVDDQDGDYRIKAECLEVPKACPRCGVVSPKLYNYGGKEQVFMDLPIHGKRTGILCQRNRYKLRASWAATE
jgi:transposase